MRRIYFLVVLTLAGNAWAQLDLIWSRQMPEASMSPTSAVKSSDGFVIAGYETFMPFYVFYSCKMIKIDSLGNIVWVADSPTAGSWSGFTNVWLKEDQNLLALGWNGDFQSFGSGSLLLALYDSTGEEIWTHNHNFGYRIHIDPRLEHATKSPNGYYVALSGRSDTSYVLNGCLLHLSDAGDSLWASSYFYDDITKFSSIVLDSDSFLVIAGYTSPEGFYHDQPTALIAKYDLFGNEIWTWSAPQVYSVGESVVRCSDGYLVSGYLTGPQPLDPEYGWYAKLDLDGNLIEERSSDIAVTFQVDTRIHLIAQSRFIVSVFAAYNSFWFEEIDEELQTIWQAANGNRLVDDILMLEDSSLFLVGEPAFPTLNNLWLARTTPDIIVPATTPRELPSELVLHPAFPNPFNPTTTISFDLAREMNVTLTAYDILGHEVGTLANDRMSAGTHEASFDATSLPSGIYFCRLEAGTFSQTQKLMLLK